tara:strand:- start:1249 stop:2322 length:1074 start_codon:yes stop_codon:yes gene_type:complete
MIDSGPQPLAPSSGVARPGVNLGSGPVLPPISLIKGQIIEGVVVQLQPRLLLETATSIFSAAISSAAYTLGERLLFKVLDPDLHPPRLELLRAGQLPDSLLAQQSAFLRSLLYRPNSLGPLQQWLSSHLSSHVSSAQLPSALAALLQEFWQLPSSPKALDIQKALLMSGLFSESRGKANTLAGAMMGPAKAYNDLKALLQLLLLEEGLEQQIKPLLEALHSNQIKSLDALLNNQLYYQWLMPWFGQQHLLITVQQNQQQRSQKQWSISLSHQGPDLGALKINLLLTQGLLANEATASLHFSSDATWLAPLVNGSKHQLHTALQSHGIYLQHVSVGPIAKTDVTDELKTAHAILDVHV